MKKNISIKKVIIYVLLITFFSISIFFIKNYFFLNTNIEIEEYNMEKLIFIDSKNSITYIKSEEQKKEYTEKNVKPVKDILFSYIPESFKKEIPDYFLLLNIFLNKDFIKEKISNLRVEFYMNLNDVRGKMKNRILKLYGVKRMNKKEFLSVSIHEFAHYIDLYYFEKGIFKDISEYFYDISWDSATILKSWQKQADFVSWYAMTNKYEDFAESFTYYILHNMDFVIKSQKSEVLKEKYNFFTRYLFRNKEFLDSNFIWWWDNELKDYYRDITKIDFDLDIFLQFFKKWI